jgi:endogenous inhibitor of DNA gyrase (YacG/DUF329 family)
MAFNDASCPKCGKRIGWVGPLENRPPCPQCGHQVPLDELKRSEEEMRKFLESLLDQKE